MNFEEFLNYCLSVKGSDESLSLQDYNTRMMNFILPILHFVGKLSDKPMILYIFEA